MNCSRKDKLHKSNFALRMAGILFGLVLISTWMTGGLLARYVSTDSGQDAARVAAFAFNASAMKKEASEQFMIPLTDICNPGDTLEYVLSITNQRSSVVSEVGICYEISIAKQGSMPLKCTLTDTENHIVVSTADEKISVAKDEIVSNSKYMTVGDPQNHQYILKVEWPGELNDDKYASGSAVGEITVTVDAKQED